MRVTCTHIQSFYLKDLGISYSHQYNSHWCSLNAFLPSILLNDRLKQMWIIEKKIIIKVWQIHLNASVFPHYQNQISLVYILSYKSKHCPFFFNYCYPQGNVVLNLFFGIFSGSFPTSHGYLSPYNSDCKRYHILLSYIFWYQFKKLVKYMFGWKLCQLLYFIIIYISSFTNPLVERLVIKISNSSTCIMHEFVLREKTVNLHFHLNVNKLGTTTNNNLHLLRFFSRYNKGKNCPNGCSSFQILLKSNAY